MTRAGIPYLSEQEFVDLPISQHPPGYGLVAYVSQCSGLPIPNTEMGGNGLPRVSRTLLAYYLDCPGFHDPRMRCRVSREDLKFTPLLEPFVETGVKPDYRN